MKIALVTDELCPINQFVLKWLQINGIDCLCFGAYVSDTQELWVTAIAEAAEAVSKGLCDQGIFFCWSGTGASIVANKIKGLRAALCTDAETARLARIWNHANVLALSNRSLTQETAEEILTAWFEPYDQQLGMDGVQALKQLDNTPLLSIESADASHPNQLDLKICKKIKKSSLLSAPIKKILIKF
jgi:ribose 5-phosphate isomerase B